MQYKRRDSGQLISQSIRHTYLKEMFGVFATENWLKNDVSKSCFFIFNVVIYTTKLKHMKMLFVYFFSPQYFIFVTITKSCTVPRYISHLLAIDSFNIMHYKILTLLCGKDWRVSLQKYIEDLLTHLIILVLDPPGSYFVLAFFSEFFISN